MVERAIAVSSPVFLSMFKNSYRINDTGLSGKVLTQIDIEREILSTSSADTNMRGFSLLEFTLHRLIRHTDPLFKVFGLAGFEPMGLCLRM